MGKNKIFTLISLFLAIVFFISISPAVCSSSGEGIIELRWAQRQNVKSVDPIDQGGTNERVTVANLYDSLVYPDPSPEILCKPWVATSWEISDDAKTYTFHLRKGVKFHDGSEVTAEDVAFSMDRQQTIGGPVSTNFKAIKPGSTEVTGRYTVTFHLEKPDPSFLAALFKFKVLNKDQILKHKEAGNFGKFGDYGAKWLNTHDAGSGPYKLVERIHGTRVVYEKFKDYSLRKWKPNSIDRVVLYITPELATIATRLRKGEVDMGDMSLPIEQTKELEKIEGMKVYYDTVYRPWYIIMNNKKSPLDDIYVRKAMAYAFEYEKVIKDILRGGEQLQGPVPSSVAGHNDNLLIYKRDIKRAKELIKKSKYSKKELSKFELETAFSAGNVSFRAVSLLAATNFKEIGLNVKIKETRWSEICRRETKPQTAFHMVVCSASTIIPHPQTTLVFYTPEGWGTAYPPGGMYYENRKVTELIEKAKAASSLEEQNEYYKKAQEIIVEDSPSLFLLNAQTAQPMWRYVKGYEMRSGPIPYEFRFDKYWIDISDEFYKRNHGTR